MTPDPAPTVEILQAAMATPAAQPDPTAIQPGPIKVTGTVESIDDRYVDPNLDGKIVHLTGAIVAFPLPGGGSLGVATNLQGLKVGAQVVMDAQAIALTKDGAVTTVVQGLVPQTIDVDPFKASVTQTTVTPPKP